ncbi:hypothetical protein [Aquisalimonas asiatica]|uniref:Uncharacterized protein n=1 Tax=Aquisalimonas asiatica TaxID=406100 RepID=A0A1H8ST37_9GAMM|nr:hypothetical protein [Aquisalimonas asiatica]SEO81920.1 hypothetical protein SAMN04488052_103186 [Aquisalimonas asiatica]
MTGTVVYKPLTSLAQGDRLARDLHDEQGGVLVPAGSLVDDRVRRRLQLFGVDTVPVEGLESAGTTAQADASLDDALNHLFRHWRCSPGMNHLRALIASHRSGAASQ